MKFNYFKYIFILIVIVLIGFATYKFKINDEKKEQNIPSSFEVEKQINLGITQYDSLNPYVTTNKNIQEILNLIYEGLIVLEQDFKPNYVLVDNLKKQEENTYIITLRDNLKFSDGSDVKIEDIIFSYDLAKNTDNLFKSIANNIEKVEKIDSKHIFVELKSDFSNIEYYLTFPIVKKNTYEDDPFPISIGKYMITNYNESNFFLSVNPNYINHDDEIILENINIIKFPSFTQMYNKFKLGGIDLISSNNKNLKDYIGKIGYNEKPIIDREHIFLAFNTKSNIFSNIEFRKAISFSIDKDRIVQELYPNDLVQTSFPLDYGTWIYEKNTTSSGFNLQTADELLVKNGYIKNTKGVYQTNINKKKYNFTFEILVNEDNQMLKQIADLIISDLNNQGISAKPIYANYDKYIELLEQYNYDMVLVDYQMDYTPNLELFFGQNNLANYQSDEIDQIYQSLINSNNDEKKELYKKLADIYKSYAIYLSIANTKKSVLYNQNLSGEIDSNWFNPFVHIYSWYK